VALDQHVTWGSSDPSILRVERRSDGSASGWLTPIRPGTAGITITYPPVSGAPPPYRSERSLGDAITVIVAPDR